MSNFIFPISVLLLLLSCGYGQTLEAADLNKDNPKTAADVYFQDAKQGDAKAALKLGLLLAQGAVGQTEYGSAGFWFKKACELGSLTGCYNAGATYENGNNGLERNYNQALHYYKISAEKGDMLSQYNLGCLYAHDYIFPQNNLEGYKWIAIATKTASKCSQNHHCQRILDDPEGHLKELKERLTKEQLEEAESFVNSWAPKK